MPAAGEADAPAAATVSPVFDAGAVRLRLRANDGHIRDVGLQVRRPNAAAMLCGRAADAVVRLLPLLYSICGAAQGVAAQLALDAARGRPRAPAIDAAVLAEARREHLWRLLLDWPRALGLPPQEALLVEGRRRLQAAGFAAWAAALDESCDRVEAALRAAPQPRTSAVGMLPPLTAEESLAHWPRLTAAFAAAPTLGAAPAETGALARHGELAAAQPLLARFRARRADLADGTGLGRTSAASVATGVGRAAVETARGLLLHEIALDGARVAAYTIVAPTEWNFHPDGVLRAWLDGAAAPTPAAMNTLASRAALALDPCVRIEIDIDGGA